MSKAAGLGKRTEELGRRQERVGRDYNEAETTGMGCSRKNIALLRISIHMAIRDERLR